MKVMYVEYLHAGSFFSETTTKVTNTNCVNTIKSYLPNGAFGFRFYEREVQVINNEELKGSPKNYSGWHYVGVKLSLEDVKYKHPDKRILISNMENNGYSHVVFTKFGQFIPVGSKDVVLP